MANLTPTPTWDDVVQLETATLALGGPGGPMNEQAQSLVNRTEYLAKITERANTWIGPQRGAFIALYSTAASIAVDLDDGNNFNHTLTENTTLAAPAGVVAGQTGVIHFTQDATTAMTLAFNVFWGFGVGVTPEMTTTLGGTAVMSYVIDPGAASATCSWMIKS